MKPVYTYCKGINKITGKPCKNPAQYGNDFCNMHDPNKSEERFRRASKGSYAPHTIVTKLAELKIRDTGDLSVAVKKIIEDVLRKGRLKTATDINVFNGLIKTAILLEQNSDVPRLIRKIESQLIQKSKELSK